ncbi:MAG TPA: hypothetical protein VM529_21985, partial [Gemmata sp.]|nr:hypothetical protein [Gemmata sp.]
LSPYEKVPWQEKYEHSWYVLACAAGAAGAWVAARHVRPAPWLSALAAVAAVPALAEVCRGVFLGKLVTGRLWTCAGILAVPLASWPWRRRAATGATCESPSPHDHPRTDRKLWLTAGVLCVPLAGLLYGLLGPHHVPTVASECNTELHVASYLVGPALYYRAPGLAPGLDFESHYGIGHAHAFALVAGDGGLQGVLERYVIFVFAVTAVYFLSAMLVLTDWLRSAWAAFAVTLVLVAAAGEGLAYTLPSCWPVRHPFLFAFLFCAVRGVASSRWCVAAGAAAGLSAYWQTDVGLYTLAAGAALYAGAAVFLRGPVWRPFLFLASGVGTFFTICSLFFGPRVFSPLFVERLFEPLLLYANGFGTELLNWRAGWGYWYNLAGPALAVASVGVLAARGGVPRPRRCWALHCSRSG